MSLKKHRTVRNSKNMFTLTLNMQHLHQAHLPSYMMWKCWLWPSGHYRGRYLLQPLLWGSAGSPVETTGNKRIEFNFLGELHVFIPISQQQKSHQATQMEKLCLVRGGTTPSPPNPFRQWMTLHCNIFSNTNL